MTYSGGSVAIIAGSICRSHVRASFWAMDCASRSEAGRVGNNSLIDSSVEAIRAHSRRNRSAFRRPSTTHKACAPVRTTVSAALGEGMCSASGTLSAFINAIPPRKTRPQTELGARSYINAISFSPFTMNVGTATIEGRG